MDLNSISTKYEVRKLTEEDVEIILELCQTNKDYYKYCPPLVSKESILCDMYAVPPNKTLEDKFYIGYFDGERLIAVLDINRGFPKKSYIYLGFFMLHKDYQGQNIAFEIIQELLEYLKSIDFEIVRLAFAKGNEKAMKFWCRNEFKLINVETQIEKCVAVGMERML